MSGSTYLYLITDSNGEHLDSEVGAGKSQTLAPVYSQNNKHIRAGAGKVEEEVHILDPSPASGVQGDSQGTLGSSDRQPSSGPLEKRTGVGGDGETSTLASASILEDDSQYFYVDVEPDTDYTRNDHLNGVCYVRHTEQNLGVIDELEEKSAPRFRCFNCGAPEHRVSDCPDPVDYKLVTLSRQLYEFFQESSPSQFLRIHEVEADRRQRLQWLDTFEPGVIQSPLLKEAVGSTDGSDADWLKNMMFWGYPLGWNRPHDPRIQVRELILNDGGHHNDEEKPLTIFGDNGQAETHFSLQPSFQSRSREQDDITENEDDDNLSVASDSTSTTQGSQQPIPRRWAIYPASYFSSEMLPVYNGFTLPSLQPVPPPPANIPRPPPTFPPPPPPPPPTGTPPPLPPSPPATTQSSKFDHRIIAVNLDGESEQDMDISDSD